MIFTATSLALLEQRRNIALINSLQGYKPACLVGSQDQQANSNLALFSSIVHLGANPPLIGVITRPNTVARDTLENIRASAYFTLNHVPSTMIEAAHQTSARYPRQQSEFSACGFTEETIDGIDAPFVKESPVKIGLKLEEIIPIHLNQTEMIIGSVQYIELPDDCLAPDGSVDYQRLDSVAVTGLNSYHTMASQQRLAYAKP